MRQEKKSLASPCHGLICRDVLVMCDEVNITPDRRLVSNEIQADFEIIFDVQHDVMFREFTSVFTQTMPIHVTFSKPILASRHTALATSPIGTFLPSILSRQMGNIQTVRLLGRHQHLASRIDQLATS